MGFLSNFLGFLSSDGVPDISNWHSLRAVGWYLAIWIVPISAAGWILYFIVGLPLRRKQRVSLFLDLLETASRGGKRVETTLAALSMSQDKTLGIKFHLLGVYLMDGFKLTEALEMLPRFLPQQIVEMLRTGERIGDLAKILPACRRIADEASSRSTAAVNYLVVLVFVLNPLAVGLVLMITRNMLPKMQEIFEELTPSQMPLPFHLLSEHRHVVILFQFTLFVLSCLGLAVCCGSARLFPARKGKLIRLRDRFYYLLPWRKKRLQRDFSTILATLLDAGVPEAEAIPLAGQTTANSVFQERCQIALERLRQGTGLSEAVRAFDDSGEFHWRLANVAPNERNFFAALSGWHEALEVKAFQQEQAFAQSISTALVLLNGLVVSVVAFSIMKFLVAIVQEGVLW